MKNALIMSVIVVLIILFLTSMIFSAITVLKSFII